MQTPKQAYQCPENYEIINKLGQGSFGQVFLVKSKDIPGQLRAMKRISKFQIVKFFLSTQFEKMHQAFVQRQILKQFSSIQNNRCIKLYQTFSNEKYIFMIIQYCEGGSLQKLVPDLTKMDKDQMKVLIPKISAKILLALQQLHTKKVIHRDLKPSNLLITANGDIKLADFGTAHASIQFYKPQVWDKIDSIKKAMNQKRQRKISQQQIDSIQISGVIRKATFVGTPYYMAPQLITQDVCEMEADLWAFGCIVFQLAFGKPLFYNQNEGLVWKKIIDEDYNLNLNQEEKVPYLKDLVKQILKKNRKQRLGADQPTHKSIKNHPFFKEINWEQIKTQGLPQLVQHNEKKFTSSIMKKKSQAGKKIIFSGIVLKKMFFGNFKERMLVLNSAPQVLYYDPQSGELKNTIPLTKQVQLHLQENNKYFSITNSKKTYHFKSLKAYQWIQMIKSAINTAFYSKTKGKV